MKKLRAQLAQFADALKITTARLERARNLTKAKHRAALKAEHQRGAAQDKADELRAEASKYLSFKAPDQARGEALLRRAHRKDRKALRLETVATRNHQKAIFWRGRVKTLVQRLEKIDTSLATVKEEIAELGPQVHLRENKVVGGTFEERWRLACLTAVHACSTGRRRNAYSQSGTPDIDHPFGPGPAAGRRDDCSSFVTSIAQATGADDPNGADFSGEGFTGTLVGAHGRWKQVSLAQMIKAGQGYIVYGSVSGHHTECYCPSKTDNMRTVGHGSPPVDFGTVHLFGSGETERYFIFS